MDALHQKYLETIRRTQWLPPEKLLAYQARLIEELARHSHEAVPFYRQRLEPLFRGGSFDLGAWKDVPILRRSDIEQNSDAMQALQVPRNFARQAPGKTSGTTGAPLHFEQSELAAVASRCMYERMMEAHGVDRTAHRARIRGELENADYPEGKEEAGWSLMYPDARVSALTIRTSVAEQAEWLVRRAPAYLMTYQSTAAALARHMEAHEQSLRLAGVFTVGETVDPLTRDDVRRVFGCEVIDSYGTSEIGYVAFQCPADGGYHVCAESVVVEVLNERGDPAAVGERGELVLTSLYNFAMPFIRYAFGDFAVVADGPCACGRTLPRLAAILGRQRNVFTFPDGSQHSPFLWRGPLSRHLPPVPFQLVQTALDQIELRYVPIAGMVDQAAIEEVGRKLIHPLVTLRAIAVAEIPRHPSGKIDDCVSLVTPLRV